MYQNQHGQERPPSAHHGRQGPGRYVVHHEFGGTATLTATLVHALSDVTGIDASDTESTLADHVDPDALDRLFRPRDGNTPRMTGHLAFSVWGYQVTVYGDGRITIVPPAGTTAAQPTQG